MSDDISGMMEEEGGQREQLKGYLYRRIKEKVKERRQPWEVRQGEKIHKLREKRRHEEYKGKLRAREQKERLKIEKAKRQGGGSSRRTQIGNAAERVGSGLIQAGMFREYGVKPTARGPPKSKKGKKRGNRKTGRNPYPNGFGF